MLKQYHTVHIFLATISQCSYFPVHKHITYMQTHLRKSIHFVRNIDSCFLFLISPNPSFSTIRLRFSYLLCMSSISIFISSCSSKDGEDNHKLLQMLPNTCFVVHLALQHTCQSNLLQTHCHHHPPCCASCSLDFGKLTRSSCIFVLTF